MVSGNTAAVARAIAAGFGPDARAYPTDAVPANELATADLIVAGSPVFGFSLPTEAMRQNILLGETDAATPPDLSHPSLRSWLDDLPAGHGRSAAFETRIWWSPRGATGTIEKRLAQRGYPPIAKAHKVRRPRQVRAAARGRARSGARVGSGAQAGGRDRGTRELKDVALGHLGIAKPTSQSLPSLFTRGGRWPASPAWDTSGPVLVPGGEIGLLAASVAFLSLEGVGLSHRRR